MKKANILPTVALIFVIVVGLGMYTLDRAVEAGKVPESTWRYVWVTVAALIVGGFFLFTRKK